MTTYPALRKRRDATHKPRRILYNNDGCDIIPPQAATPDGFLSLRTAPLVGTHVDTVLYCSHISFGRCTHDTAVGDVGATGSKAQDDENVRRFIRQGRDCLRLVTDFCHRHGMETFWSMRMNDVHDGNTPRVRSQFKIDHSELLIGQEGDHSEQFIGASRCWSAVDYKHQQVRNHAFRLIEEVCRKYDVDGVELDFFRHPFYFGQNRCGLPAEPHQVELMTELIRRVHTMTVDAGQARGRPILIAVRGPDSTARRRHIGLDFEQWAQEGLIDLIIPGGYFHTTSWQESIDLGHQHDIPVFPCVSATRVRGRVQGHFAREDLLWRGEALNALEAGADGIHLFNHFKHGSADVLNMGDPQQMKTQRRVYAPNHGDLEKFVGKEIADRYGFLPQPVPVGHDHAASLEIHEDLRGNDKFKLTLRVLLNNVKKPDEVQISLNGSDLPHLKTSPLNGQPLSCADIKGFEGTWFETDVGPDAVNRGNNHVTTTTKHRSGADVMFQDVQIEVNPI